MNQSQEWSDYKLKWDPKEYGGIEDINLPAEQIWLPDIVLYNSAEGYFAVSIMTKAKVHFDGHVTWNPPAIFRSSCQIDITYFPFDSQDCHLKFGSWTFGTKLDLRHINDTEGTIERGTDLSEYYQNVEWDIMQASARRNVITYMCCPNDLYIDVTFNFTLRRKPLFYTVNLILPCVGITFFSFLVFYLPSDSGEKVTLTISILVSLIFFLSVLIETIPPTSLAMPLLGKYLVFTMILITLSVCATVCVLNIHFRTPSTHPMPAWIKRWCMDILPKYLFMSVPQYQSQQANILPEQLIYLHNQAYASQAVSIPIQLQQQQQQTQQKQVNGKGNGNHQTLVNQQNGNLLADIGAGPEAHSGGNQGQANQSRITTSSGGPNMPHQLSMAIDDHQSILAGNNNNNNNNNKNKNNNNGLGKMNMLEPMNDVVGSSNINNNNNNGGGGGGANGSKKKNKKDRPKLSANQQRSSSSRSSGRHPLEQLDASNLANLNNANSRQLQQIPQGPGLFLPYLQSDTARRLQLQRSRSSERDKSNSDNQPPSTAPAPEPAAPQSAGDGGASRGRSGSIKNNINNNNKNYCDSDRQAAQMRSKSMERSAMTINVDSGDTSGGSQRKATRNDGPTKQPSRLPFWRIFRSSPKSTTTLSDKSDTTQPAGPSQISQQARLSMASSTSSALFDPNDDYQHHRHFQARASICSNNLWRIGPTRRCSLAVPLNYPTFYKPLAQLQHQHQHLSGQNLNTISGSCASIQAGQQRQPPVHYHVHGEESSQSSTSSTTVQEKGAVGALVSGAASSLVTRAKPQTPAKPDQQREMEPMTSGGFIQIGAQFPHAVSAIPPRLQQSVEAERAQTFSGHLPPPPPPLPPADFSGPLPQPPPLSSHHFQTQIMQMHQQQQIQQQQQQQQRTIRGLQQTMDQSFRGNDPIDLTRCADPLGSRQQSLNNSSMIRSASYMNQQQQQQQPILSGQYLSSTRPSGYEDHALEQRRLNQQQQVPQANSRPVFLAGPGGPITLGHHHYLQQQHIGLHSANLGQAQSMPRSRSTDHRLSNFIALKHDNQSAGYGANNLLMGGAHRQIVRSDDRQLHGMMPTNWNQSQQGPNNTMSRGATGQSYPAQKLQRQPTIYSLHSGLAGAPSGPHRETNSSINIVPLEMQIRQLQSSYNGIGFNPEHQTSIDMLRRSRSQTSLNRRSKLELGNDCEQCAISGRVASNHRHHQVSANDEPTRNILTMRPRSEIRGRLNSAGRAPFDTSGTIRQYDDRHGGWVRSVRTAHCNDCSNPLVMNNRGHDEFIRDNVRVSSYVDSNSNSVSCRCKTTTGAASIAGSRAQNLHSAADGSSANRLIAKNNNFSQLSTLDLMKLVNEVEKAIQNAMFIAQHIDNLDEFESVKENWKYIAMVIDRIFLIIFLFACIVGTVAIFSLVPWSIYLTDKPIELQLRLPQS